MASRRTRGPSSAPASRSACLCSARRGASSSRARASSALRSRRRAFARRTSSGAQRARAVQVARRALRLARPAQGQHAASAGSHGIRHAASSTRLNRTAWHPRARGAQRHLLRGRRDLRRDCRHHLADTSRAGTGRRSGGRHEIRWVRNLLVRHDRRARQPRLRVRAARCDAYAPAGRAGGPRALSAADAERESARGVQCLVAPRDALHTWPGALL